MPEVLRYIPQTAAGRERLEEPWMADIFISYKREDRDRVEPFAHALEREGFSVWWDADLLIGSSYSSSIKSQLNEARAVIPVWTSLSVQSEWVQEEATQGKRRGVLFPIRFDNVDPPIGFTMVETADLSGWREDHRDHPEWSRLLEQLRAKLKSGAGAARSGTVTETRPPIVRRTPDGNRAALLAGGGAIVLAFAVGGFMMQRGCRAAPDENASAASVATPRGSAAAVPGGSAPAPPRSAAATATSGSAPGSSGPIAPREVAAPPVAAGANSTLDDPRALALGVAEPGEILSTEDT